MGQTDWQKLISGVGFIADSRQDNSTVPDDQLSHDVNCRRLDGDRGHWLFRYTSSAFTLTQDLSIRAAIAIKRTDNLVQSVGVGIRIDDSIFGTPVSGDILDRFNENGYQLMLYDDHSLNLHRLNSNLQTPLFNTTLGGTIGQFKWYHVRLDFLLQSDERAVVQIFTNDLDVNPVTNPVWTKISPDIVENKTGIPQTDRMGFGGLVDPAEATYIDRVEILKS
jgi:hypothetical protein